MLSEGRHPTGETDNGRSRLEPRGLVDTKYWPDDDGWVCNCIVFRGDRLLLLLREHDGFLGGQWDLPGGKLDAGEQPAESAARELGEEAGLEAAEISEFAHYSNPEMGGENYRFHTVTFLVREADDSLPVRLSEEHPDFKWVTRAQFDELPVAWYIRRVLGNVDWGTISTHHGESD